LPVVCSFQLPDVALLAMVFYLLILLFGGFVSVSLTEGETYEHNRDDTYVDMVCCSLCPLG